MIGEDNGVDEGGEEWVDNVFIKKNWCELELGTDLHKSNKSFGSISQKISTVNNGNRLGGTK